MTRRNLIECLESYQATKKRIDNLEEDMFKYKSMAMSLGNSIGSGMPSAHNSNNAKYTKAIETLQDIEQEYLTEIGSLKDALNTTKTYIELEHKPHRKIILQMRYIDGLSISKIAIKTEKSNKTIYKVFNNAIQDILDVIE